MVIDQATAVRAGEGLDLALLQTYLERFFPPAHGALTLQQFPGGYSNLTYLLHFGDKQWVLRRPPISAAIKTAHDIGREYRVISQIVNVYPKVPHLLHYCEDASVIGGPFYLMERVQGIILRAHPIKGVDLNRAVMQNLSQAFIENLADLHKIDVEQAGLVDLGKAEGYVARQVAGWSKRYQSAQTEKIVPMEEVMQWLQQNQPADSASVLIHNDYKYDNLVLDPNDLSNILAVLDWEMATLGDPLMDLGSALSYWTENADNDILKMFGLSYLPGNLSRQGLLDSYQAASGRAIAKPVFYYVFGLFKLAVIVQQLYSRYKRGATKDPRFAPLIYVVHACSMMAVKALEQDRISALS